MLLSVRRRHQHGYVLVLEFDFCVTKDLFSGRADGEDYAAWVNRNEAIVGIFQDQPIQFTVFLDFRKLI